MRDSQSVETAMRDVDYVFHAAALKQVPSCNSLVEAVKTNILVREMSYKVLFIKMSKKSHMFIYR